MSRAAGGVYSLPAGNPVVTSTVISSTWANTTLSDMGTALTDSLSRSGLGGMTAPLLGTDGIVALPAYSFTNEPTTGLYRIGAANVGLSLGNKLVATFNGGAGAIALSLTGDNSNTSTLNLTNSDLTKPVFARWGRNATTFDAYIGVAGAANDLLTASAQGDFAVRSDNGGLLFGISSAIKGKCSATAVWTFWEGTNNIGAAALMQAATMETGSFSGTTQGITGTPSFTITWRRVGTQVTLDWLGNSVAASTSVALTVTGLPAALSPARAQRVACLIQDNTINEGGYVQIAAGTTILTFVRANGTTVFTNAGNKGVGGPQSFTYNLT